MTTRKAISKTTRFEVFKRDKFTCQYCGAKAPEAILHVDHIDPVAKGGGNEIMNLLTACAGCNSGKRDKKLSDQSAVQKQRAEIEALEERRQQIEMMMRWRRAAQEYRQKEIEVLITEIEERALIQVTESEVKKIIALQKKYPFTQIMDAIDDVIDGPAASDAEANRIIPRIANKCSWANRYGDDGREYAYIQGILRRRFSNKNARVIPQIHEAHKNGADLEDVKDMALRCSSINNFLYRLEAGA